MKIKLLLPLLFFCVAANAGHGGKSELSPAETNSQSTAGQSTAGQSTDGQNTAAPDSLEKLRILLGDGFEQPEFLDVDDAFRLEITEVGRNRIETAFAIADGYYLYRDKIVFSSDGDVRLMEVALPPGEIKNDQYFGEMAVFKHDFSAPITLQRPDPAATSIKLHATYQGCAESGICYSPVNKTFSLELPEIIQGAFADSGDPGKPDSGGTASSAGSAGGQTVPAPTAAVATAGSFGILLGAFLAGLLLTFTPCVLPMLPILSGIIAGQGGPDGNLTRTRGVILALAYVLGTMLTYAVIGALAGATGDQLQAYFQNIWAIGIFSSVLVAMALSMFGFFQIQTPSFIQSGLQNRSRRLSGSLPLVFVLGAVSAMIVGACVSPILISFLGIAISAGDPWLGARMMVAMALGLGVPLIALGLGAGYLLPATGRWMETVNHILGVMLIAVAIYLLGTLPEVPVLLLWGAFFIIVSVQMGAIQASPAGAGGWQRFVKGIGVVMLVWGVAALIGGFFGERNLLRPLPVSLFGGANNQLEPPGEARFARLFTRVGNLAELEQQFARAAAGDKLVMLDYYADWCVDCARMEETTFRDPRVRETLQRDFVSVQIDVTDPRDEDGRALKKRFGVFGPPAVLWFDRNGVELKDQHFYGYRNSSDFYALITALAQK